MRTTISITRAIPFIILAIFSSCRKDEPVAKGPLSPLLIPQEVKDYTYFLPGTYWIYKEESSGAIDSVYVVSAAGGLDSSSLGSSDPELNRVFEWFEVVTKSSFDGYNYKYKIHTSFSANCLPTENRHCFRVNRIKTKPGSYMGETWIFFYRPIIGDGGYSGYSSSLGYVTLKAIYDSIVIAGNIFYNVIELNDNKNATEWGMKTNVFIGNHFGIARKEVLDSNLIWNLIRYNIVQ